MNSNIGARPNGNSIRPPTSGSSLIRSPVGERPQDHPSWGRFFWCCCLGATAASPTLVLLQVAGRIPLFGNTLNSKPGLCPIGLQRTPRLLTLAMVLVAGYVLGWPSHEAQAQQAQQDSQINGLPPPHRGPTLRDVWGPPKMPPPPKDFGPHFDFPSGGSQNLTCGPAGSQYFCGAPSEAPYPN
jgi:hypothetical protein